MEFVAEIMKFGINMEHHSGMVIKASGGFAVFLSVYPGHLHSMGLGLITDLR